MTSLPRADQAAGTRPPFFDDVEVGIEFGPATLLVDDHAVAAHTFAIADHTTTDGHQVTPAVLANDLLLLYYHLYRQVDCAAVGTRNTLYLHQPVVLGDTIVLTGHHTDRYIKRDRGYVVSESRAHASDGSLVALNRATEIMDGLGGQTPTSIATGAKRPTAEPVAAFTRRAYFDQVCVYSRIGRPEKNIHNDHEFAASRGFGAPVVQGLQQMCYAAELGRQVFGSDFWSSGVIDVRFVRPVFVDDTVTVCCGPLRSIVGGRAVDCWVQDGEGYVTCVGTMSCGDEGPLEPQEAE